MRRKNLYHSALTLTLVGLTAQLVGFVYRVILSRMIGAELMGLYQLVLPVYAVLQSLLLSGLTVAVASLTPCAPQRGKPILSAALKLCILFWIPLAVVVIGFSDGISVTLLNDARTQLGVILLLPCLLLTGIENLHKHWFYGQDDVVRPGLVEVGEQFIRSAAVLGLLYCFLPLNGERTVGLIVCGMMVSEVFSSCALTLLARRKRVSSGKTPPHTAKSILRIAAPVSLSNFFRSAMESLNAVLIPRLLIWSGLSPAEAMSRYGVLFGMTMPLLMLPGAFVSALCIVLVPDLASNEHPEACRKRISSCLSVTSNLTLPITALAVTVGPTLGRMLFSDERAGDYIIPLSAAVVLSCWYSVLAASLNGMGRQQKCAGISLLCGSIQLGMTLLLVPRLGLSGFVLGDILCTGLGLALLIREISLVCGFRPNWYQALAAPSLAAILTGLVSHLLFSALQQRGLSLLAAVLATIFFGVVLYLVTLRVLRPGTSNERR